MIGQITEDSAAGGWISTISKLKGIKTIVEIGTWNGMGSTLCVINAIKGTDISFMSIEASAYMCNMARANLPKDSENVSLLHGHVSDELIDIDTLGDIFFSDYSKVTKRSWLEEDKRNISTSPNLIGLMPDNIDFLILDGGEFSSWHEFLLLKDRAKYIFLDDTRPPCIKNHVARRCLIEGGATIIFDDQSDRNGYSVFKL